MDREHAERTPGRAAAPESAEAPALLRPYRVRGLVLRNRIVVSPMCQYSCEARDGLAGPWHLVHLGRRAVGGAALVFTEAAAVAPEGRISPQDLGIWSDAQAEALAPIAAFVRAQGAAAGIQLAHAGRKASTARPWEGIRGLRDDEGGWTPVAPSPVAFSETYRQPREMTADDVAAAVRAFAQSAARARRAGFDVVELHAAHGYLLHQFLSPLSNRRTDGYGGSFERRIRFLLETVEAVRETWPADRPLFVRLSATDWVAGGWSVDDSVRLARELARRRCRGLLKRGDIARAAGSHGAGLPGALRGTDPAGGRRGDDGGGPHHRRGAGRSDRSRGAGGPRGHGAGAAAQSLLPAPGG